MQTFEAVCAANEQQPDRSHIGTLTLPGRSRRPRHPPVDEQIQEDHEEHAEDEQWLFQFVDGIADGAAVYEKYCFAGQMAGWEVQIHRNPRILAGCDRRQTARASTSNQCCYTPAVKFFASRRMSWHDCAYSHFNYSASLRAHDPAGCRELGPANPEAGGARVVRLLVPR